MTFASLPNLTTGTYNMPESGYPCAFATTDAALGTFLMRMRHCILCDRRLLFVDGQTVMASINWIRDHVHEMKAFMHWEYDLKSFLDFIILRQHDSGFFYELIKQTEDLHWSFVDADCRVMYPEDALAMTRLEIEADVEYLVVEGVHQVYRATGDLAWVEQHLPALEKAIDYCTSDPKRWDEAHGLVKRAFTIDTWDFVYGQSNDDRRIHPDTPMCIMHGDNSGVFSAMRRLASFHRLLNNEDKAAHWEERAEQIRQHMLRYLWNGRFFIHNLPLTFQSPDHLEGERLSLSNTYDINRGVTTPAQAQAIIDTYRQRANGGWEWFSIDPPYERFGNHTKGNYVNGGYTSFTAGELALAAFENGREAYGWDVLRRAIQQVEKDGNVYFLYDPKTMDKRGGGPSGWGAAALLNAVDKGLAGIEDTDALYKRLRFSPRFPVTPYTDVRYVTGYEVSNRKVDVRYHKEANSLAYRLACPSEQVDCHLLLPQGANSIKVTVNGAETPYRPCSIGDGAYADFTLNGTQDAWLITLEWKE